MKREAIRRLLPSIYQTAAEQGGPLDALLGAMEQLHARDEQILDRLHEYFDPYLAPPGLVPFLARWVDLDWLLVDPTGMAGGHSYPPGLGHLRNLIAAAPELSARRGTAEGLRRFLEVATGVSGYDVDDRGPGPDFHVTVSVPGGAAEFAPLVERIVATRRPAHATYELHLPEAPTPAQPREPPDEPPDEPSDEQPGEPADSGDEEGVLGSLFPRAGRKASDGREVSDD